MKSFKYFHSKVLKTCKHLNSWFVINFRFIDNLVKFKYFEYKLSHILRILRTILSVLKINIEWHTTKIITFSKTKLLACKWRKLLSKILLFYPSYSCIIYTHSRRILVRETSHENFKKLILFSFRNCEAWKVGFKLKFQFVKD